MSRHTKGRLSLYSCKLRPQFQVHIYEIQDESGDAVVKWTGFDGIDKPQATTKANAERLVACWNYCQNISTAELRRRAAQEGR